MKYDIISIGSATLDVFLKSTDFKLMKTDEVFTGEALLVPYGSKNEVNQLLVQSGGGGTNTAVGFSRLGLKTAVLARCGHNFAAKIVRGELKKEKVGLSLLCQLKGDETDYSTILVGHDGGRSILVYRGGTRLEEKLIPWKKLQSKWFYISSLEGNLDLLEKLLKFADEKGIKTAVNPGRKELEQKEKLLEVLNRAEVVILNREEAARLTGLTIADEKIYPALAAKVKEMAVVTNGANGVVLYTREDKKLVSNGFKVKAEDSTGAGDGFGCGLIAGLALGWEIEESLKLGVCNGASVVTLMGAKTGLLYTSKVEEWLKKPLEMGWEK